MTPKKTNGLDRTFGPSSIRDFIPKWEEIPAEFKRDRNEWNDFVQGWFFNGVKDATFTPKNGVDKNDALGHCATIMRSFEPKHEHKIAGVAFLLSQWFEPPWPTDTSSPNHEKG